MSDVLMAAAFATAIATASLPAAPEAPTGKVLASYPSPAVAAGLSVAGGVLGLAPAVYGASPATGLNPALIAPALTLMPGAGYWYQQEWLRGALTPLGGLAAGVLGFFVVPAVMRTFDSESTAASPTGAAWAQSGALLGYSTFQLLVTWDAYRLALEKSKRSGQPEWGDQAWARGGHALYLKQRRNPFEGDSRVRHQADPHRTRARQARP